MERQATSWVLLMALLFAGTAGWWPAEVNAQRGPRIGRPAPEMSGGPWINSKPLSFPSLRGRVILVEFWTYG